MYVFNLMVETLSTFLTMHVFIWTAIIWCYWIRSVVLMRMSWVEAQDDWVVILSSKMWVIRSVNRVYVDNLGPTGTGETLSKFWWNLCIYIYIKLPEIFQYIAKKNVEKSRPLQHKFRQRMLIRCRQLNFSIVITISLQPTPLRQRITNSRQNTNFGSEC